MYLSGFSSNTGYMTPCFKVHAVLNALEGTWKDVGRITFKHSKDVTTTRATVARP